MLPLSGLVSPVDPDAWLCARSASDDGGPILAMMAVGMIAFALGVYSGLSTVAGAALLAIFASA